MKNRVTSGIIFILLGALISLGPLYLFKVCKPMDDQFMRCFWTARAEFGIGILIAVLGFIIISIPSAQTRLGITISLAFTGILAAAIPSVLIGVCDMPKMNCHAVAVPAILIISILVVLVSVVNAYFLAKVKEKSEETE